jgi:hypothetical protein
MTDKPPTPNLPESVVTDEMVEHGFDAYSRVWVEHEKRTDDKPLHIRTLVRATLQAVIKEMYRAANARAEGWLPIESAPKHVDVLVWREDCGTFIAKLTTPDAVIPEGQLEEMEFPDDFEEWWSDAYGWQEGSEKPTHWQHKPNGPDAPQAVRSEASEGDSDGR